MDNIILGLLFLCSRTIYQLRDRIDKGIHFMYSSSMGSIQAAIKKLLRCGYIDYVEVTDNGKHKKVYHITENGRQRFLAWVNAPLEEQHPKSPELTKVYFMGFSDKNNREAGIRQHIAFLKEQFHALEVICEDAKNVDIPEEYRDVLAYQLASARYGRDLIRFNVEWFEDLLGKVRNGEL